MNFKDNEKELILNEMLNYSDSLSKYLDKLIFKEDDSLNIKILNLNVPGFSVEVIKKIHLHDNLFLIALERKNYNIMLDKIETSKDIFISNIFMNDTNEENISLIVSKYNYLEEELLNAVKCSISQREKNIINNNLSLEEVDKKNKKRL